MKPPVTLPADYRLHQYVRCQLQYVVARELTRSRAKASVEHAYEEAGIFVDAVLEGGQPLSMGAPAGYVHWPTWICAANAYAYLPPEQREYTVERLRSGQPVWIVLAGDFGEGGCERDALVDPEYQPEPHCIPKLAVHVGLAALASFVGTVGLTLTWRALTSSRSRKQ